ncbi:LysM peptidoglycan-binding domain-containing protein [Vibrio brasiliensis]|uniref:LysM peptidoglycan-binding domain-containing protein n=1 Tax=Vibrio brasiliensis TaxID=170652 RepID=UPI001EFD9191|nr:LysM domain-containing protein [Vibrio brasiliensis]MCG9647522.1 LysM peptidoglycan-binding domain-containing protein [Vibrio brasiliensis]
MKTHVIRRGETLSQLAKHYNTDVATLQKLNAEQIKDIDLIFDGNKLILPEEIDNTSGERAEKQTFPNNQLVLAQCSTPKYVDALYVPEHPHTRKQMLLLLTEEAKQYVIEDHQRCQQALSGDNKTVLAQLTKLGVMDQFNSITHEVFLSQLGDNKVAAYRKALLERSALKKAYSNNELTFPNDDIEIALVNVSVKIDRIEQTYSKAVENIENEAIGSLVPIQGAFGEVMLKQDAIDGAQSFRVKQLRKLQQELIEDLDEAINKFEQQAMEQAASTTIDEQGHQYKFSNKHGFYSSNIELNIYDALETINKEKKSIGLDDSLDSKDLKSTSKLPSLKKAYDVYCYWEDKAHAVITKLNNQQFEWEPMAFFNANSENRISYRKFFAAVHRLNQTGTYLKEQCLNKDELFKSWQTVESIREGLENKSPSIDALIGDLNKLNKDTPIASELGYYSAYVLNLVLLQEIAIRIRDFSERFGNNDSYNQYVKQLFLFAENAQERCKALRTEANGRVDSPNFDYQRTSITFVGDIPVIETSDRSVVLNEAQWKPKNLDNHIFANNGVNQRTVVECALSSAPQKLLYILSDSPVLSTDIAENKKCTSIVNLNLATSVNRQKEQLSKAFKQALGGSSDAVLSSLKFEKSISWANISDVIFPWSSKEYENETLGITAMTETSGGAQFARFTYSASTAIDQNTFNKGTLKAEFQTDFSLASTEQKITLRLPASGDMQLDIPYRVRDDEKRHTENIGSAVLEIEGKVYGVLAASLKVSTQLHIGNMEESSGEQEVRPLGIKGTVPSRSDYTNYNVSALGQQGSRPSTLAAGATAEAKAFAGLEAGGVLSCKLDWAKDQKTAKQNLFKVSSGFKVSAGIGYDGVFQCTFNNGRFIFITAMAATTGIGFGGKFATELNPKAADDFFAALLGVMNNKGFQRFEFFDESGKTNSFAEFNKVLTVAAAFGLTIGQVMMLPFNIIDDMEKQATDEKNAYFVANFLLSEQHQQENQKWITNMPAETLAKLLSVLINYNSIPEFSLGIGYIEDKQSEAATRNQNQRKAINQILNWLGANRADKGQIIRFENALQRMGLRQPTELDKSQQWQRYAKNVLSIRDFFTKAFSQPYENPNDKDKNNYMETLEKDYTKLCENMFWLTQANLILEKTHPTRARIKAEYAVLRKNEIEQLKQFQLRGYQLTNWLPER